MALVVALAGAAPAFRLVVLPVPEGCESYSFLPHGLSDAGPVTANLLCTDHPGYQAALWDDEGLHVLAGLGGRNSYALGISHDGRTVAGAADTGDVTPDGRFVTLPVLWTDGTAVALETLGGPFGAATDVGQGGVVVGGCELGTIDPRANREPLRACRWVEGVASDLGVLEGPDAEALDINKRGWVVGWATSTMLVPAADARFAHIAFIDDGSGVRSLGTLGGDWSDASAVNESGLVVGYSEASADADGRRPIHAFAWRRGEMRALDSLAGGYSAAWDVNDRGDIAGTCMVPVPGQRATTVATLWRGDAIHDLNQLTENLDGWALRDALAIDNSGRILVQASRAGQSRIAVLEPNER